MDANEAVTVSLVRSGLGDGLSPVHEFHPKFTYPIFGEEERIFGYKGLQIDLKFNAHNLSPKVEISYEKKFKPVGTTVALNLNKTLKDYLPAYAFDEEPPTDQGSREKFRPPGALVHSYNRKGRKFEIWAGSLLEPKVREALDKIQILVLLFIEAATYIKTDDVDWTLERWKVYFLYEVIGDTTDTSSPYSFAGYATTYRFWNLPPPKKQHGAFEQPYPSMEAVTPLTLPSRLRISQFLVLPPYQRGGHGSSLYQTIYSEVMADPTIHELSIEDPSEECDKLRDINDWKVLKPAFQQAGIKINDRSFPAGEKARIIRLPTSRLMPMDTLKKIQRANKIADRQFARQVEMFLLSLIGYSHRAAGGANLTKIKVQKHNATDVNDRAYYWWRLLVKQRITRKNRDLLQQMDLADRFPVVEDSLRGQEDEYEGLLLYFALAEEKESQREENGASDGPSRERKRKIIDDDEDEVSDVGSEAKKMRA